MHCPIGDVLKLICWAVVGLFRSRASLEVENLTLRHQLDVLRRRSPKRLTFGNIDRLIFATLYRFWPSVANALASWSPRPLSAGIAPASACFGDGSRDVASGDQKSLSRFAN